MFIIYAAITAASPLQHKRYSVMFFKTTQQVFKANKHRWILNSLINWQTDQL